MIKFTLTLITLLFLMTTFSSAQENSPKNSKYEAYAGRYGSSSGVSLFANGTYLLYGYATAVFGTYKIEKDRLIFTSDAQELFEVFGSKNPSIGDSTRINFKGFDRGTGTYVQLGGHDFRPVFNENANCFSSPFVYQQQGVMDKFSIAAAPSGLNKANAIKNTLWNYVNNVGYNDFIFVYNKASRESEDFEAVIVKTDKGDVIKLSSYGGDEGYLKHQMDEDGQEQWKEILDWKKQYDAEKELAVNEVFANQHYRVFPKLDTSAYSFDQKLNLHTALNADEVAEYYKGDQYQDPRFLRKYEKLSSNSKKEFLPKPIEIAKKSIFFTVCGEGSEKSYKYDGFVVYENPDKTPPVMVAPIKIQKQEE